MKDTFKNDLNENHGVTLLKFSYNGIEFQIRITNHGLQRYKENDIDMDIVCGDIVALGEKRLYDYAGKGEDVAIIDYDNDFTIIITFEKYQIRVKTIINKSNVWVKKGTIIYNLYKGGF